MSNRILLLDAERARLASENKFKGFREVVRNGALGTPEFYGRKHLYKLVDKLNNDNHLYAGFYKDSDIFYIEGEKHIDAIYFKSPFEAGDEVAVKEPWFEYKGKYYYMADKQCTGCTEGGTCLPVGVKPSEMCKLCEDMSGYWKWKGPVTLKKEAVRNFLNVTAVSISRLQETTVYQVQQEIDCTGLSEEQCMENYKVYWDSKHVHKEEKWGANPWVWNVEVESGRNKA